MKVVLNFTDEETEILKTIITKEEITPFAIKRLVLKDEMFDLFQFYLENISQGEKASIRDFKTISNLKLPKCKETSYAKYLAKDHRFEYVYSNDGGKVYRKKVDSPVL